MTMIHLFFYQDLMYNKKNNSLDRIMVICLFYKSNKKKIMKKKSTINHSHVLLNNSLCDVCDIDCRHTYT
jgi:hypothetical protein